MLEKGFLKDHPAGNSRHHKIASIVSNVLLYLGTLVLVATFAYLFFKMEKSDGLIVVMAPLIMTGLGLIIVSQLIKRAYTKLRR